MNKTKTIAIVQARMESKRLPNKMMLSLHDEPIIGWVFKRLSLCKMFDKLIFALPDTSANDLIADYLSKRKAIIYRGSAFNLVDRFYSVANLFKPINVVRICADNPCICPKQVDLLIDFFLKSNYDYAFNHIPLGNKYPNGIGAEICRFSTLKDIYNNAVKKDHQEHLFNYILDNQEKYSIGTFDPKDNSLRHPEISLDIDTLEDYKKLLSLEICSTTSASEIVRNYLS